MSIESVMPSSHLILCCSLLLLPSIFPSIRVFSNESALCIWWPKYWSFSFKVSPTNEHPGLISFRMDWLDLKSLLQHHSSKASILQHSAFFIVQLLHPYMTTGKTIALTRWTFVGKVMSLLFNMLSRLVITFLSRSKCLLISWLQSPSAVILEPRKIKSATALIHGSNIPGSYAILLFIASDSASITSHAHNWVLFLLWLHPFILSGVVSPLISSSILGTYRPGEFIFQCPIFFAFSYCSWGSQGKNTEVPFLSPVEHILSELEECLSKCC